MYDFISDVHGRSDALKQLFNILGYKPEGEIYVPSNGHMPAFIGDLLDKGPQQRQTIELVRAMDKRGLIKKIMGNHELNAIMMSMIVDGEHIRPRNKKNLKQNERFLADYPLDTDEYFEVIEWFKTFPVFLDLDGIRAIHAYWDNGDLEIIAPYLNDDNSLKEEAYLAYARNEQPFRGALENLLKGPFIKLPSGVTFLDKQGHARDEARRFWWLDESKPLSERMDARGVKIPSHHHEEVRQALMAGEFKASAEPVVIGHYSLKGRPRVIAPNVIGTDFEGHLCAYRWSGESQAAQENYIAVPA